MTDEELKELRDKLDLCYQPGGKLVWSEVKKVLEDAYDTGFSNGWYAYEDEAPWRLNK